MPINLQYRNSLINRPAVVVKSLPGEDEVLAFPVVGVDHAAGGEAPEVAAGLGGVELAHRRYRLHTVQSSVWRVGSGRMCCAVLVGRAGRMQVIVEYYFSNWIDLVWNYPPMICIADIFIWVFGPRDLPRPAPHTQWPGRGLLSRSHSHHCWRLHLHGS